MCEIKDFLRNHPGINIHWVEKQCGIPVSTIKLNSSRPIPTKYIEDIKALLSTYGWQNNDVHELSIATVPAHETYIYRLKGFGYWDKSTQWAKWIEVKIPDDTVVLITTGVQHS